MSCPFCDPLADEVVARNDLAYARPDRYPVSPGHLLIVPFRHVPTYFEATAGEQAALLDLVARCRPLIEEAYHPDGYNLGINVGAAAGQTVPHLHLHLIPRYVGDVPDPRGGVRGVVPEKKTYP
ncbi:diadenosine tetraphosphate (Ap4A) HIT family hydrolase [Methanofollis sp. W23]|uniref:HIT family protein n=1 Tax=Methanofollis sp. W23 TaxID=2817849 RepID=UPI001AEA06D9|nr:HIT family protein [Methanofollis sp. W23]MBP2146290.1 diadenosine tetraphosphate (Ap4A) HIT family hydrolase [Methanofollis sp. W23]